MKKTKRIKAASFQTRAEFERAVDRAAYVETELRRLAAERDAAVQEAQKTHAETLAALSVELKATAALCEKYAEDNRAELLPNPNLKSGETLQARFGFRLGNRTIVLLSKKCSWDAAVGILKAFKLGAFVRTKEEVNKETLLAGLDDNGEIPLPETDETEAATLPLATVGLKVAQAETFFIEPKVDGAAKIKAEAA